MRGSEARRPIPEDAMNEDTMDAHVWSRAVTTVDSKLDNLQQKIDHRKGKLDLPHARVEKIDEKTDALRGEIRTEANRLDSKIDSSTDRLGTKIDAAVNRLDGGADKLDKKVDGAISAVNAKLDEINKSLNAHQLAMKDLAE